MIYKITNIRLRNGRTLNRGFIIESDKMLSRNKIATLIKERTNFTPIDFSAKMHRNLFESQEDVDAAIAAGNKRKEDIETENGRIRGENETLRNSYKTKHEGKVKDRRDKESNNLYTNLQNKIDTISKSITEKNKELKGLEDDKTAIETHNKNIEDIKQKLTDIDSIINRANASKDQFSKNLTKAEGELKELLNAHNSEQELDEKITNLKNKISEEQKYIETGVAEDKAKIEAKLEKKYGFSGSKSEKEYKAKEKKEIDKTDGVNLATVENYFEKKRKDLTNIIAEFDKKVKRTKEGDKVKTVYTRLENVLKEFSNKFDEIKNRIIKQYEKSNKNKASSASITPTEGSGRPSNNHQINIRKNSLNNPRMKGSGKSSKNRRINIRGNLRK